MPNKVADPQKIVTDPVLLSFLAEQGIDNDYVELFQGYASRSLGKEHSPYAKFYRDLQSDKRFMVVSGLPMVDADGVKIEAGWRVAGINYFSEKNNLFRAKAQGTQIEITVRNDQPDGRKANGRLSFKPQLFLDGVEQTCGQPTLLPVDPVNSNYLENTLEWDYGICKRRLRIIEGGTYGSWIIPARPSGIIRTKYNQVGDFRLRLGRFATNNDEELITPDQCDELAKLQGGYPVTVSDSATFNPDPTTSVDGTTYWYLLTGDTWAKAIAAAAVNATYTQVSDILGGFAAYITTNIWYYLWRSQILFPTGTLPDNATISAATESYYGSAKLDEAAAAPTLNIYSSAPETDTALVVADHSTMGTTIFCDTAIAYAGWSITGYNDFALNAAGLASISKTGNTKHGTRQNFDISGTPTWVTGKFTYMSAYFAEKGTGYKPKLVVTYTVPAVKRGWWSK